MYFEEKTIESKPIFKGRIIEVKVDRVLLPGGQESTREIVLHAGAVAIVAIDDQENLYLVRQYRKPLEKTLLEIPAGTLEEGEEPLHCAQRELEEEVGMKAERWEKLLSYYSAPGFCNELLHIFLATGLTPGVVHLDADEFVERVIMPLDQAVKAIETGQIADGKSIIGIQCWLNRRAAK
ncbi:MAG TPA: ADP-ribose pyrophosphatase [Syntrophomonas sp.]|jgi:ADP-ribose pyrophosphatase|nr:ADP-ribose pyrophosphatase [Syntrophomonas sp.]